MNAVKNNYMPSPGTWSTDSQNFYAVFQAYDMGGYEMYTVEIHRRSFDDEPRAEIVVDRAVKYTPAEIKVYAQRTLRILAAV